MIREQFRLFLTALMFYTRIPVPFNIGHESHMLNRATRYFPLIGLVVGAIGVGVYWLFYSLFGHSIALAFSMAATILATGAFHEDGFADMCDAFGGGWTVEKKLTIMKDSRIGTYGSVGLIFILGIKYLLLSEIGPGKITVVFITAHMLSRVLPVWLIYTLQYVQDTDVSKSKPIGHKNKNHELLTATLTGIAPLLFLGFKALLILPALVLLFFYLKHYFTKQIGGYTGDCLGAAQQLAEITIYLSIIAVWTLLP